MIVVRVELHSAINGKITELGSAVIDNVGGTGDGRRGNYRARAYRKGDLTKLTDEHTGGWPLIRHAKPIRTGSVTNHPRLTAPIWSLVRKALESMEY